MNAKKFNMIVSLSKFKSLNVILFNKTWFVDFYMRHKSKFCTQNAICRRPKKSPFSWFIIIRQLIFSMFFVHMFFFHKNNDEILNSHVEVNKYFPRPQLWIFNLRNISSQINQNDKRISQALGQLFKIWP